MFLVSTGLFVRQNAFLKSAFWLLRVSFALPLCALQQAFQFQCLDRMQQIRLLPVTDEVLPYAESVQQQLNAAGIRATTDHSGDRLGKLIRTGEQMKIPVSILLNEGHMLAASSVERVLNRFLPVRENNL